MLSIVEENVAGTNPSTRGDGAEIGFSAYTDSSSDVIRGLLLAMPALGQARSAHSPLASQSAPSDFGNCLPLVGGVHGYSAQRIQSDHRTLWPGTARPPHPGDSSSNCSQSATAMPQGNGPFPRRQWTPELAWLEQPGSASIAHPASDRHSLAARGPPSSNSSAYFDPTTRQQIDEFEDLIDKIDRWNDVRMTVDTTGSSSATEVSSTCSRNGRGDLQTLGALLAASHRRATFGSGVGAGAAPVHAYPVASSSAASSHSAAVRAISVDDDFEILLEQNPTLLDLDCDSGVEVSPRPPPVSYDTEDVEMVRMVPVTQAQSDFDFEKDNDRDITSSAPPQPPTFSTLGPVSATQAESRQNLDRGDKSSVSWCKQTLTHPPPHQKPIGPPTSLKSATMTTRTNLKQILQMQQVQEQERREQQTSKMMVASPGSNNAGTMNVPLPGFPGPRKEVPSEVLKVHSRLENPTRYHVMENRKRQVQQFLSTSIDDQHGQSMLVHSVPNVGPTMTTGSSAPPHLSSSAPSPDSPNSVGLSSSAATSASEADVIDSIIQMESSLDTVENANYLNTATLPSKPTHFLELLNLPADSTASKSCPSEIDHVKADSFPLADVHFQALVKDRQKKDNHNMIERRRRFNINDRIKELATLLPKSNDPYYEIIRMDRQNKGTILKASVDFIKELKREVERLKLDASEKRRLEQENWKLKIQNQQLLNIQATSSGSSSHEITFLMNSEVFPKEEAVLRVKQEPLDPPSVGSAHSTLDDLMEDDSHPVNGDPMLPSPMLGDDNLFTDGMEFVS